MRTRLLPLLLTLAIAAPLAAATRRRSASPDRCVSTVSPASVSIPAAGGHASVTATVTGGCNWSPIASDAWIGAAPASGGVSIDVAANPSTSQRTGFVHVRSAVVVITQAGSTNLVSNGGFDNGTAGWSPRFSTGQGSISWGAGTFSPFPGIGANAVLVTTTEPAKSYQLDQCINVTRNTRYEVGTKVMIPSGQSSGLAGIAVYEYQVPDCNASSFLGSFNHRQTNADSPAGSWGDAVILFFTDSRTQSFLLVIGVGDTTNPPFSAWFDDVYVRPKP
jgi:hypothetical protein